MLHNFDSRAADGTTQPPVFSVGGFQIFLRPSYPLSRFCHDLGNENALTASGVDVMNLSRFKWVPRFYKPILTG